MSKEKKAPRDDVRWDEEEKLWWGYRAMTDDKGHFTVNRCYYNNKGRIVKYDWDPCAVEGQYLRDIMEELRYMAKVVEWSPVELGHVCFVDYDPEPEEGE